MSQQLVVKEDIIIMIVAVGSAQCLTSSLDNIKFSVATKIGYIISL